MQDILTAPFILLGAWIDSFILFYFYMVGQAKTIYLDHPDRTAGLPLFVFIAAGAYLLAPLASLFVWGMKVHQWGAGVLYGGRAGFADGHFFWTVLTVGAGYIAGMLYCLDHLGDKLDEKLGYAAYRKLNTGIYILMGISLAKAAYKMTRPMKK